MPTTSHRNYSPKTEKRENREIHEFHAHLAVETDLAVEIVIWPWFFLVKRLW